MLAQGVLTSCKDQHICAETLKKINEIFLRGSFVMTQI